MYMAWPSSFVDPKQATAIRSAICTKPEHHPLQSVRLELLSSAVARCAPNWLCARARQQRRPDEYRIGSNQNVDLGEFCWDFPATSQWRNLAMTIISDSKSRPQSNASRSPKPETAKRVPLTRTGNFTPRTSDLLIAMRQVIGPQILSAIQIVEGLRRCGVLPRTREPEPHLRYILSSHPELFARDPEQRGSYRLHANDLYRAGQAAADDDGQQCSPTVLCGT